MLWTVIVLWIYLAYLLLADYGEVIFWAVLASFSIRPWQSTVYETVKSAFNDSSKFSFTRNSYLLRLFSRGWIGGQSRSFMAAGICTKVLVIFALYLLLKKVRPKVLIPLIILGILVIDIFLRFFFDLALMLLNLMYKPKERNQMIFSLVSLWLLVVFFVVGIMIQVAMMAMVAIEFSKYGQRLFYEFDSLAQNFNMEDMVAFLEPHI